MEDLQDVKNCKKFPLSHFRPNRKSTHGAYSLDLISLPPGPPDSRIKLKILCI